MCVWIDRAHLLLEAAQREFGRDARAEVEDAQQGPRRPRPALQQVEQPKVGLAHPLARAGAVEWPGTCHQPATVTRSGAPAAAASA